MVNYPSDWKKERLDNIVRFHDNRRIPVSYDKRILGNTPYYGANGIQDYIEGYTHDGEYVLIAEDGANDVLNYPVLYVKGKIWVNNHAHVLSGIEDKVNTKFLSFLLKKVDYESILVGGTRVKLNKKTLESIFLTLPKQIEEQQAIAYTLSSFDKHIDNLTRLIEKKKAIRDGALEDLVTGKNRLAEFDEKWESVLFNDVIVPKARIGWQGLKKHEYLQNGYSYLIGGTDFNNGTINTANIWSVSKERYQMDSNIQVSTYDVLVTKDGTIGKVALVPKLNKPATLNSGVFVFKTNSKLNSKFLYRVLTSSIFKNFITTLSAGSTIKHLYQKDLKNLEFKIPTDIKEQEAIAEILTAMDDEIISLEKELDKMKQIREGAMDDLLTGRVCLAI